MIKINEEWKQGNGKYQCPYCYEEYSKKGISSHIWNFHTEAGKEHKKKNNFLLNILNNIKVKCQYCNKEFGNNNLVKHEKSCYLNPKNLKECPVCNEPIKNYKTGSTCSYSCSNTKFRSGLNHGNWKEERYVSTCFYHHKKKCIVCDEDRIVEVHHYDHIKSNNSPENLMPLCPTHHRYWHSRYIDLVKPIVDKYREEFIKLNIKED